MRIARMISVAKRPMTFFSSLALSLSLAVMASSFEVAVGANSIVEDPLMSGSINHDAPVAYNFRGTNKSEERAGRKEKDDEEEEEYNADGTPTRRRLDHEKDCKLKLYWKDGYTWQEERTERKWCVQDSDGRAKIKKCRDTSRQDWMLNERDNTIRLKNDDDKCLEVRDNQVYVKDCQSSGSSRDRQKFQLDWDGSKFEITRAGRCMTQQHHPRENEKLKMVSCGEARRDDTSLWECE